MLQFTLTPNRNITLTEQALMAIKTGCAWIDVNPTDVTEEQLNSIIEICRENEIILVFTHNDPMLEQKRVHGIILGPNDADPLDIRNRLGGHPIIGVTVTDGMQFQHLKRADVDYIILEGYPEAASAAAVSELLEQEKEQGVMIPIVVSGRIMESEIQTLIDAGASGINIDINSLQGPEYEASLSSFMAACNNVTR